MRHLSDVVSRHPRHVALAALVSGLLLSPVDGWAAACGPLVAVTVAALTRRTALAVLAGMLVWAGAQAGAARLESIDRARVGPWLGTELTVRGHLMQRQRPTVRHRRARLRLTAVTTDGGWTQLDDLVELQAPLTVRLPDVALGEELEVRGTLERPRHRPGARFDYAAHLDRAGVHALLLATSVRVTGASRGGVAGVVDDLRRRAEAGVEVGLDPRLGALARGIVLGQDERISASQAEEFTASGLAHLLAVSGQNVTLLALLALPLLGVLGFGRNSRLLILVALIAVYVPLTGAGPSILRAGAMGVAGAVAALAGRQASRWYALLLAAAFTLALDPRSWADAGWQLSFAAVVGILALAPRIAAPLARLPEPLPAAIAATVAATVATAPLTAFHFERVSTVSLVANLLAFPAVAPIMWLGTLAAVAAQVSTFPALLLNALNGFFLAYLSAIAHWAAALPSASVPLSVGSPLALACGYGAIAVAARTAAPIVRAARRRPQRLLAFVCAAAAVVVAIGSLDRSAQPPARFAVTFLDVGQGDATLIQAPGPATVLVDGGPPGSDLAPRLRELGVRSLDVAVLTHAQADHQGGLEALVRELPPRLLLDGGVGRDADHARIVASARAAGSQVVAATAGQAMRLGRLHLRVLAPERQAAVAAARAGEDPNTNAVVLLASYGSFDLFLPADAESDVTLGLPLAPVEALKVAHHGSEDEGLAALLERLRPRVAAIEVGAGNRHGHPHPRTLEALRAALDRVYRTDRDGDVRLTLTPDGPAVETQD